jgi:hypothetical protein
MTLNETREWPETLSVAGNDFVAKFLKPQIPEKIMKGSIVSSVKTESLASTKKNKKTKMSRIGKWAEKMKQAEGGDNSFIGNIGQKIS